MRLLRAATLTVADVAHTEALYSEWLDYRTVEKGALEARIAQSLGAPASAGRKSVVMQPSSGAPVYLRFVEGDPHPDFKPLRTYGWQAVEICVQDVLAVNERMKKSPFEIIGPPRELDGMPAIFPMQVKGPDQEIVYLTQIRDDLPSYDLPRAESLIDKLFILVLACSDLKGTLNFASDKLGLSFGRDMAITYTMLANAFNVPHSRKFTIATVIHERDVFLEFDQMPPWATARPCHAGQLSPGVSACTLLTPDFDARINALEEWIIAPPVRHDGAIYDGRLSATVRGPDGTLYELVSA
jgi:catechol 2,3-dioxygenase-like lactoylglutathione lyase family enzyme